MTPVKTTKERAFRVLGLAAILLASLTSYAQIQQTTEPNSDFATKALANYVATVVTERNVRGLGFKDITEAKFATLGEPIKVTFVGLRDLRAYSEEKPVTSIIRDAQALWYPVLVSGKARAKLEVLRVDGKPVAGEFGSPISTSAISSVVQELPDSLGANETIGTYTLTLLKIPILNAQFIHISTTDIDYLIPAVIDAELYKVEIGKAYPANVLLDRLKEFAQEIDENKLM